MITSHFIVIKPVISYSIMKKSNPVTEYFKKCAIDAKGKKEQAQKDRNYLDSVRYHFVEQFCKEQAQKSKKMSRRLTC